jgi:hypothetical protein
MSISENELARELDDELREKGFPYQLPNSVNAARFGRNVASVTFVESVWDAVEFVRNGPNALEKPDFAGGGGSDIPPDDLHPLPIGWPVTIFRFGWLREPSIEGIADTHAMIRGVRNGYCVLFPNEKRLRERIVLPGPFQENPQAVLAILLTAWRAATAEEALNDFPDA